MSIVIIIYFNLAHNCVITKYKRSYLAIKIPIAVIYRIITINLVRVNEAKIFLSLIIFINFLLIFLLFIHIITLIKLEVILI